MPNVTKSTTNNLVSVSYPVREVTLEITKAEHALILVDGSTSHKIKMIRFIRAQYNLGLYDAKKVVDTVIASAEAEPEVQLQSSSSEIEVDWSKVIEGTWIDVRDYDTEEWVSRRFVKISESSISYPFVCYVLDSDGTLGWKYAKLSEV